MAENGPSATRPYIHWPGPESGSESGLESGRESGPDPNYAASEERTSGSEESQSSCAEYLPDHPGQPLVEWWRRQPGAPPPPGGMCYNLEIVDRMALARGCTGLKAGKVPPTTRL